MLKKLKKHVYVILLGMVASYVLGALLNSLAYGGGRFVGAWVMFDGRTFLLAGMFALGMVVFFAARENASYWARRGKSLLISNMDKIEGNLENSSFLTDEERDEVFLLKAYEELEEVTEAGVIVRAEEVDEKRVRGKEFLFGRGILGEGLKLVSRKSQGELSKRYEINFAKASHSLVIGTTGSGKTTAYINPSIHLLSKTKMQPSMLIADPKEELLSLHREALEKAGYRILVVDLRKPFSSVKWNPLSNIYKTYQRMINLDSEVELKRERGTYVFDNKEYRNPKELFSAIKVKKQKLYDEAYEDLHDIITCLCPIKNKKEPIWESGARNFALGIALAMLEDSQNPDLKMTEERFNFYNLTKIATDNDKNAASLKKYFSMRDPLSKAASLSRQILTSADNTRNSYLTTLYDQLSMFSDMGVCSMTSSNEVSFREIVDEPTVVFLQIPDEKETRHTLASMIVLQAYKELVARANQEKNKTLPRPVYFILDEFGNLPPIHKIEQMITVGRSRNIWLCLVVQSYAQLAKAYGNEGAEIIKANCNVQIFIGTTDQKTLEEMSKRCGNYGVMRKSIGTNSEKEESFTANLSVNERPLIYPTELARLNKPGDMGNAIVTVFGFNPLRTKFTPSYVSSYLSCYASEEIEKVGRFFDEEGTYYDIKKRNVTMEFSGIEAKREKEGVEDMSYEESFFQKSPVFLEIFSSIFEEEEILELLKLLKKGKTYEFGKKLDLAKAKAGILGKEELLFGLEKAKLAVKESAFA